MVPSPVSLLSLLLLEDEDELWLGSWQPYLLSEVSLEGHPLSPFAFRDQVLILPYLLGAVVLQVLGQFVPAAAPVAAVVAALPREVVRESPQVHPMWRQTKQALQSFQEFLDAS